MSENGFVSTLRFVTYYSLSVSLLLLLGTLVKLVSPTRQLFWIEIDHHHCIALFFSFFPIVTDFVFFSYM